LQKTITAILGSSPSHATDFGSSCLALWQANPCKCFCSKKHTVYRNLSRKNDTEQFTLDAGEKKKTKPPKKSLWSGGYRHH